MLNDLLSIERGLVASGTILAGRHEAIKDMAKGSAIRVRLSHDGRLAAVEVIPQAGGGVVWTLRDGQHNGFPGLKTLTGLLSLTDAERMAHQQAWDEDKTAKGRREELLRMLGAFPVDASHIAKWPNAGHRKRIVERLASLRQLANDPVTAAVPATFERFLAGLEASPPLLESLTISLTRKISEEGDEWLEPARMALVGPVALAIDVMEMEFDRDAGDPRQVGPVGTALSGPPSLQEANTENVCALSGQSGRLHTGNFPQPNLPGLGQTYIFSRNRDIPSLTRYGRTADASFPVNSELVRRLSSAVTALTQESAKGRTWRLTPAETGDKPDLLIVGIADIDIRLADALGDDDEVGGGTALNELGSRVIDQSRGILEHGHPQDQVTVVVLRTVDPANRKVIYHRKTAATEFWKAARRWKDATVNTPEWLVLPSPLKGKSEVTRRAPPYLSPLSITPLSRVQFANGGRRKVNVIGVPAAHAFSLFLHEGNFVRRARSLLRLMVSRHGSLLGNLAAARTKGIERLKDFDPKADLRRDGLRSVTWLGALLYHAGRRKETYMSDVAFRLGQLLETADVVHIGYCADLRGGDVPPRLLGNSVLAIAGANPVRALAILESRLKPYLAWAKREERLWTKIHELRTKEPQTESERKANRLSFAIRTALFAAPRFRELADELRSATIKGDTDDTFKAELLLGYLAGLPQQPKKTTVTSSVQNISQVDQSIGESA